MFQSVGFPLSSLPAFPFPFLSFPFLFSFPFFVTNSYLKFHLFSFYDLLFFIDLLYLYSAAVHQCVNIEQMELLKQNSKNIW